ncbi:hypothetical protein [Shewanella psychromarinicola]|uniref:Uncharacterized protein n=1 Tax=Shewanella psychromarinicola TaxID=2487742 RepID=A0A3N4DIA5_9GAMM|nr:hypothetical protein [Shewanella psychromarinicola]AZG33578.1 hypothetical protein EGC80_00640 [Shewanella psychromarinicola]MCL1082464.1 hypothetical protein [Shewanella psychromarinicola]RPA23628.1 hypothetical protein EGC77_18035 [Shewanella psychromarinicola]
MESRSILPHFSIAHLSEAHLSIAHLSADHFSIARFSITEHQPEYHATQDEKLAFLVDKFNS